MSMRHYQRTGRVMQTSSFVLLLSNPQQIQKRCMRHAIIFFLLASGQAFAASVSKPEDLLAKVIEGPSTTAEAQLSGPLAENLQRVTHSSATPMIKFENLGKSNGCFKINQTLTVPKVPDTSGNIVGDWVTVTRLNICNDNKLPAGMKPQEVLSCNVGRFPCPKPPVK